MDKWKFLVFVFIFNSIFHLYAGDVTATLINKREMQTRQGMQSRLFLEENNGQKWYIDLPIDYMLFEAINNFINIGDVITFNDAGSSRDGDYKRIGYAAIIFVNGENILLHFPSAWSNFSSAFDRPEYQ
jgi:hypothetical protein